MAIQDHCIEVYGADPAELDNDEFIDACNGGGGASNGMTVDEFDRSMRERLPRASDNGKR